MGKAAKFLKPTPPQVALHELDEKVAPIRGTKMSESALRRFVHFRNGESRYVEPHRPRLTAQKRDTGCEQQAFMEAVERYSFNDPELVKLIHRLAQEERSEISANSINAASNFMQGEVTAKLEMRRGPAPSQRRPDALEHQYFAQFLQEFIQLVQNHGSTLQTHPAFKDLSETADQAAKIYDLILTSSIIPSPTANAENEFTVQLDPRFHEHFPQSQHSITCQAVNPYHARSKFLQALGLDKYIDYFLAVTQFVQFVYTAQDEDKEHYGTFPTLADGPGFSMDVEGLIHADKGTNKAITGHKLVTAAKVKSALMDTGLLVEVSEAGKHGRSEKVIKWREGLGKDELSAALETQNFDDKTRIAILESHQETAFQPWERITIDAKNRLHLILGENANGKSTLLKSAADAAYMTWMSRQVPAKDATIGYCDRIFHNFELTDSLNEDTSTFQAQVRAVVDFIKNGTKDSLGIFDEIYHGTNSAYLVAIAWATLEAFSKRGLRAMVSSHEQLLERLQHANGYESIKGLYAHQVNGAATSTGKPLDGFSTTTVGANYQLKSEPTFDSNAFKVLEEAGMPNSIITRAREVYAHITTG